MNAATARGEDGCTSPSGYIPPYPHRFKHEISTLTAIWYGRRNLIAIWEDKAFDQHFFKARILAQDVFVANHPAIVREVFVEKFELYEMKTSHQRQALRPVLGDGLLISHGDTWRKRRPIVARSTHSSCLARLAPAMTEVAERWRHRWSKERPGTVLDVSAEMGELAAEIICRSIFGRRLHVDAARRIVDGFTRYQAAVTQIDYLTLLGVPEFVPRWVGHRVKRSAAQIRTEVAGLISEASLARGDGSERSIVGSMMEDGSADEAVTRKGLLDEATVLFLAGHETTANTLSWAWFLVSQAPWAESALREEARQVLRGRVATHEDVSRLIYTRAVIQETLRLYPPIPIQGRQASRDDRIRRRAIPKGSAVVVVPWLLHRHRRLWRNPDHFEPERWLPGGDGAPSKYAYVPFGIGPRICSGAAFAMTEAVICLATLVATFRLRPLPDQKIEPVCRLTLRPGKGLRMALEHVSA